MKVAIVHDWLNGMRGGEKVLEALLELFPDSTIYTLFYERGRISERIAQKPIVTSWLDRIPGVYRHYRNFLPLFPAAIESFDLKGFDLIISSSHAVAKGVRKQGALHISYCHTPMRYLWDSQSDYRMNALRRLAFRAVRSRLRRWDRENSRHVDFFIANSDFVRQRIKRYYGFDAAVIHPPVDTLFFTPQGKIRRSDFYLVAGALTPYKKVDVILQAFNRLGKRLVVAGSGPELARLRKMAGPTVEFPGWVSDFDLRRLYCSAQAFVFAARDDFGIMPVEAQSCGCPVLAFAGGGALETVHESVSGLFFAEQTPDAIIEAVRRFEIMSWPIEQVRSQVQNFSRETFKSEIQQSVAAKLSGAPLSDAPQHA